MTKSLKWRFALIAAVAVVALFYFMPSVVDSLPGWWKEQVDKIRLGLDLKGGMHLVLEVQAEKAVESTLNRIAEDVKSLLRKERIRYRKVDSDTNRRLVVVLARDEDAAEKLDSIISSRYPFFIKEGTTQSEKGFKISYIMSNKEAERIKKFAVAQALETIRNRVDQFGVSEPEIAPQGKDRILVQLPGIKDAQRALKIIGKTALLEFKLVDDEASLEEALKGNIPPGDEILYQRLKDPETGIIRKIPYLLKKKTLLTGDMLKDARVRIHTQFNEPYVALSFNKQGARIFDRITAKNVKKRLAIVLDNNVYSAPVIQERISGGEAQITGIPTLEEAKDLAIVLRAGSLPAPVKILENRTVGPSLGQDSIRAGIISIIVGGILVVGFMVLYYRWAGVIADIALIFNVLLILSALAGFKAVLTLPGIAGIVLTIGMAIDANVLIFERVREELRSGKTPKASIDGGYSKAFLTIMDANITTLIAALVLFQFGTGPIKGFAVTLSIGILASLFTALFVTRAIFDYILMRFKIKELNI